MVKFTVLTCRLTAEFLESADGVRSKAWSPTVATGKGRRCLIPGYVFLPTPAWLTCSSLAVYRYNLRPLLLPGDTESREVDERDIDLMRAAANKIGTEGGRGRKLIVGQDVRFILGPFEDYKGRIVKVRPDTVRVLIGNKIIAVSPEVLEILV